MYSFILILLIIPLINDSPEGIYEMMWILYLLPPILVLFYHGYKTGILTGLFCVLLQSSYELHEYFLHPEEYSFNNFNVTFAIAIAITTVTLSIGFLMRHREKKQIELEKLSQDLEFLANHDTLTALPNRRAFEQRMDEALQEAKDTDRMFALIFCDLDQFKNLNDTAGHRIGDLVLFEIAQRVKQIIRGEDFISRLGGDEFIIFLDGVSSPEEVTNITQAILSTIEQPIILDTLEYKISASLGIALYPQDSIDPSMLLQHADIAMYQSKARGNGNYTFFTPEMGKALLRQTRLASGLKSALARNEFTVVYQPLCDAKTGEVTSAEALIRWNHSKMGLIPPNEFIPIAEETRIIIPIGEWVLRSAVQEAKRWHDAGHMIIVAVNISCIQLEECHCYQKIQQILAETGLEPQFLELEITERVALSNPEEMIRILNNLRSIGIKIAIDDFGTGYSSLSYLKKYPVHTIKIDRSFIQDIAFEVRDRAMLKALLIMAKSLNFSTVAEGVETPEQFSILSDMGCNVVQGFLLSTPLSGEEFFNFITNRRMEEGQLLSSLG
ncbi:putative bifunctional diguanylate cyclase/phosphodiesterase [Desulfitobacterium metallireducens]|uniref:putative bifunctional diguanylate cyclase/phosphodiesterase n=1 Tax=Desulfitobacterium metallireducens TaxID=142877 RepID=UPI00143B9875|nr:EAL domain-containing protein [Desulfitobacterium metallireducens]